MLKTKYEIREFLNDEKNRPNLSFVWYNQIGYPKYPFFKKPYDLSTDKEQIVLVKVNDADYEEDENEKIFLIKPYNMYVKITRKKEKLRCESNSFFYGEEVEPYEFKEIRFKKINLENKKEKAITWIQEKLKNKDFKLFSNILKNELSEYFKYKMPYNLEEWDNYGSYIKQINITKKFVQEEILDFLGVSWFISNNNCIIQIEALNKFYLFEPEKENMIEVKPVEQTVTNYVPVV